VDPFSALDHFAELLEAAGLRFVREPFAETELADTATTSRSQDDK
jgi:hypothetical protein